MVTDGGSDPDTLTVAACTPPLATMIARSDAGSTTITLNPTVAGKSTGDLFNTSDKSLIWVGDGDYAKVRSVSGDVLTVDTDPTASGDQGLLRSHPLGAVISRVDVHTFHVDTDPDVALPEPAGRSAPRHGHDRGRGHLRSATRDGHAGAPIPESALTGRTERHDPVSGAFLTRGLVSDITLRN